jgi:hypothetical protein
MVLTNLFQLQTTLNLKKLFTKKRFWLDFGTWLEQLRKVLVSNVSEPHAVTKAQLETF